MDSIRQQQPEQNQQDLVSTEAIKKIQELAGQAQACFFCTSSHGATFATRPMAVFAPDERGHFWFLSASDSNKNAQLQQDPNVHLLLQGSSHSDFLSIVGTATVSTDQAKIKELWNPVLKTWFTGGEEDPRLTVIEVTPEQGYYWDNKHGDAVQGVKIAIGALIGQTLDDSIEGTLRP